MVVISIQIAGIEQVDLRGFQSTAALPCPASLKVDLGKCYRLLDSFQIYTASRSLNSGISSERAVRELIKENRIQDCESTAISLQNAVALEHAIVNRNGNRFCKDRTSIL